MYTWTRFYKIKGNLFDKDKPSLSFRWCRYLNLKEIPTVDGNSHRGFRAGIRAHFQEWHKKSGIPFSLMLHKDKERLVALTNGDMSATQHDIEYYKKDLLRKIVQ